MHCAIAPVSSWIWGASGKHPVVKDFIRIGPDTPLMNALSRWVEDGYQKVGDKGIQHSWRFFARGMMNRELCFGLVRDSHDGSGRPFPLIIMGSGILERWDKCWDMLPQALEAIWENLEFLSVKRVCDLEELKGDIGRLPAPILPERRGASAASDEGISLPGQENGMITAVLKDSGNHLMEIEQLLRLTGKRSRSAPDAVFIGGALEQSSLVVFYRPLKAADFVRLWTMGNV
jgi:type VI secretion system ImpM family protein